MHYIQQQSYTSFALRLCCLMLRGETSFIVDTVLTKSLRAMSLLSTKPHTQEDEYTVSTSFIVNGVGMTRLFDECFWARWSKISKQIFISKLPPLRTYMNSSNFDYGISLWFSSMDGNLHRVVYHIVLTEHTLACRQREPRSDLSGRISLIEGIKKVFFFKGRYTFGNYSKQI